ncbi:host attachment protein [Profundibacter amoris]|nr:host attachment protein [Profundibacter amoris]
MKTRRTWILITDSASAHILENTGPGKGLKKLDGKVWHAQQKDAYESPQGMTNNSVGRSMHRMAPHSSSNKEESAFAKDIAVRLSKAHAAGEFDDLVLAAPPGMLGLLRPHLDDKLQASVIAELPKDLVKTPEIDLKKHFTDVLAL